MARSSGISCWQSSQSLAATAASASETTNAVGAAIIASTSIGDDGLIAASLGHFDQTEYERQLEHGVGS